MILSTLTISLGYGIPFVGMPFCTCLHHHSILPSVARISDGHGGVGKPRLRIYRKEGKQMINYIIGVMVVGSSLVEKQSY